MTGRMLNERAGHVSFWLAFIGFNLTFFPMHNLGLAGMPRRIYTYLPDTGWGKLNFVASVGAGVLGLGMLIYVGNALVSLKRGAVAGRDPWGGATLEWSTSSPPPSYNFAEMPVVSSRDPLWDDDPESAPVVTGLATHKREVLITRAFDAEPDHRYAYPSPSIWPFLSAVATSAMFVASLFTPWAVAIGLPIAAAMVVGWFWPTTPRKEQGETA